MPPKSVSTQGPERDGSSSYRSEGARRQILKDLHTPTEPSASPRRSSLYADPPDEVFEATLNVEKLNRTTAVEPRGALDPSNTCYRNAVIFTLLCNDEFMGFIRRHWISRRQAAIAACTDAAMKNELQKNKSPFELLSELWETYWKAENGQHSLNTEVEKFWKQLTPLTGDTPDGRSWKDVAGRLDAQQDAKEFLEWIVKCEQDMARPLKDGKRGEGAGTPIFEDYNSIFKLQTSNWRICALCEHNAWIGNDNKEIDRTTTVKSKRIKGEADRDEIVLRLALHDGATEPLKFHKLLWQHFKYSQSDYYCDDCLKLPKDERELLRKENEKSGVQIPAWKYIGRLPEVLFVHLDRVGLTKTKNRTEVSIPRFFRFHSKFFKDGVIQDWEGLKEGKVREGKVREGKAREGKAREAQARQQMQNYERPIMPMYELVGVISHQGTANAGHYKTMVQVDKQWWDINRTDCTKSDWQTAVSNKRGFDPVLLVWRRKYTDNSSEGATSTPGMQVPTSSSTFPSRPSQASTDGQKVTQAVRSGSQTTQTRRRELRSSNALSIGSKKNDNDIAAPGDGRKVLNIGASGESEGVAEQSKEEFWLRLKVELDNREYLLHHQIHPIPAIAHSTRDLDSGPEFDMDLQMLQDHGTGTTYHYDLLQAAKRDTFCSIPKLKAADFDNEPTIEHAACHCGEVHDGACRTLKRKASAVEELSVDAENPEKCRKVLPALFRRRGDDPYNYPNVEERYRIQGAIQRALQNYQDKRQGRMPAKVRRRAIPEQTRFSEPPKTPGEPPKTPERFVSPGGYSPPFTDPLPSKRYIQQAAAVRKARVMQGASMVEQLKWDMMRGPIHGASAAPVLTRPRPYTPSQASSSTLRRPSLTPPTPLDFSSSKSRTDGYQSSQSGRFSPSPRRDSPGSGSSRLNLSTINQLASAPRPPQFALGGHPSSWPLQQGTVDHRDEDQLDVTQLAVDNQFQLDLKASVAQSYKPPVGGAPATSMPRSNPDDPDDDDDDDDNSGVPRDPTRPSPSPRPRRDSHNIRPVTPPRHARPRPPSPLRRPPAPGEKRKETWGEVVSDPRGFLDEMVKDKKWIWRKFPPSPRYVTSNIKRIGEEMHKHPLIAGMVASIGYSIWCHRTESVYLIKQVLRHLINAAEKGYFKSEALAREFIAIVKPYYDSMQGVRAATKASKKVWLSKSYEAMKLYRGRMLRFMYEHLPMLGQQMCDAWQQGGGPGEGRLQHDLRMGITSGPMVTLMAQRNELRQDLGSAAAAVVSGLAEELMGQGQQRGMDSSATAEAVNSVVEELSHQQGAESSATDIAPSV